MSSLSPRDIVSELNRHIVGQENAKKAVALALRNRWRRMQLPSSPASDARNSSVEEEGGEKKGKRKTRSTGGGGLQHKRTRQT